MLAAIMITVTNICRHPVKSLTAEALLEAQLVPGRAIPNDRRFGLLLGSTPAAGAATEWMPKTKFLALVRNAKLAALETQFDDETDVLTVLRGGKQVACGKLTDRIGRIGIEVFFAAYMGDEAKGRPKLVEAGDGHVLSDHKSPVISILNLASVKDLERVTQKPVDPLRFRANLWLDELEAWRELDWVGRDVKIGNVSLNVTQRINRCAATSVNPQTAERDINVVKSLQRGFGHIDMGVFARVATNGAICQGDEVSPCSSTEN